MANTNTNPTSALLMRNMTISPFVFDGLSARCKRDANVARTPPDQRRRRAIGAGDSDIAGGGVAGDLVVLDELFCKSPHVLWFGVAENRCGYDAIASFRAARARIFRRNLDITAVDPDPA
jgi:hypothetical protein